MGKGIAIVGLNGGGKSTLTHALSVATGYFEMDVEDYYFPEQSSSRKWSLDHDSVISTDYLGELPFSVPRSKREVEAAIRIDMEVHPEFIIAGVTMNWSEEILSKINVAFLVQTPLETRLERLKSREEKRFGERAMPGGDMYAQQLEFREVIRSKDDSVVKKSIEKLGCPVIVIDGTLPIEENIETMLSHIN